MLKLIIILGFVILQLINCQYYNSYDYQYSDFNTSTTESDYYDHDWRTGFQNNSAYWNNDNITDNMGIRKLI